MVKSAKTATTAHSATTAAGCMAPDRCSAPTPAASQKDQASPLARWYARKPAAATKITVQATNAASVMIISLSPRHSSGRIQSSGHQLEFARLAQRGRLQSCDQERREALDQQLVVFPVHGGHLREELERVGAGERVRKRPHHEVQAPRELLPREVRKRAVERLLVARDHPGVLHREELADERRRVGVGAAEQPQEVLAPAPLVAREPQRRHEHRREDALAGK